MLGAARSNADAEFAAVDARAPHATPTIARVAFVLTTCHEFDDAKVLSSVLQQHGHVTYAYIAREEKVCYRAALVFGRTCSASTP